MSDWHWQTPWWLWLGIPVLMLPWWMARRKPAALLYSDLSILKSLPTPWTMRVKRFLPWLRSIGLTLVVVALARPQLGLREFRIRTAGIAIEMCIDRSGSMQALDFTLDGQQVDRLQAVKHVFRDFVAGNRRLSGRPDDLIGLVSFGGFAEGIAPLTLDHGALLEMLDSIKVPQPVTDQRGCVVNEQYWQEESATAIGDAVALAVARVRHSEAKSKVVILLSDGENNAGVIDPADAAATAKEFGVKIYSIGVGRTGVAPFPVQDRFGRTVLEARPVRLDETTLRMLADTTHGRYFHAEDTESLEQVYAAIDALEKTTTEGRLYTEYRELFLWFLLPGLSLIVVETVLSNTRFRSLP